MLKDKIDELIKNAIKEHNKEKLNVYRLIKSKFVEYETSKNAQELDEEKEINILKKMVSSREESKNQYQNANREDLAANEQKEIDIIKEFIPKEPSEEEITDIVKSYIEEKGEEYALSMKDMKPILNLVKQNYPSVNAKNVSNILNNFINR